MQIELTLEETAVINAMRTTKTAVRRKNAAKEVATLVAATYFADPHSSLFPFVSEVISRHGFVAPDLSNVELGGKEGEASLYNFDLQGAFLTMTCYRMQSGRWEIVAYVS